MHIFALLSCNLGVPKPTALFCDSIRGFKNNKTQEYVTFFYLLLKYDGFNGLSWLNYSSIYFHWSVCPL